MKKNTKTTINVALIIVLIGIILLLSYVLPSSSMLFPILKKVGHVLVVVIPVTFDVVFGITNVFFIKETGIFSNPPFHWYQLRQAAATQ